MVSNCLPNTNANTRDKAFRGEAYLHSEQVANADTIGYSIDGEKGMPKKKKKFLWLSQTKG